MKRDTLMSNINFTELEPCIITNDYTIKYSDVDYVLSGTSLDTEDRSKMQYIIVKKDGRCLSVEQDIYNAFVSLIKTNPNIKGHDEPVYLENKKGEEVCIGMASNKYDNTKWFKRLNNLTYFD